MRVSKSASQFSPRPYAASSVAKIEVVSFIGPIPGPVGVVFANSWLVDVSFLICPGRFLDGIKRRNNLHNMAVRFGCALHYRLRKPQGNKRIIGCLEARQVCLQVNRH